MDKREAIRNLLSAAQSERTSNAEAQRVVKACKALGLNTEELSYVLGYLDITMADGTPYSSKIKRTW